MQDVNHLSTSDLVNRKAAPASRAVHTQAGVIWPELTVLKTAGSGLIEGASQRGDGMPDGSSLVARRPNLEEITMRLAALALVGAIGFMFSAAPANAAPAVPNLATDQISNVVQVAGGCGRGFHRNYRGFCVRNYYRPYRPRYARPYYPAPRYYGYHRPYRYW
jgi:hypothetical protein